jgi:CRISPR-associated protein Csx10
METMIQLDYNLLSCAKLYLGAKKPYGGNFMESLDYIPGVVMRGAVANLLLEDCAKDEVQKKDHPSCPDKDQCNFYKLFESGNSQEIIFTDCYPQSSGAVKERVWVLPATARSCKYHPGFKSDEIRDNKKKKYGERLIENHGVFDILIPQLVYEELNPSALTWKLKCNQCGGRIDRFGRFYHYHGKKDYEAIKPVSKVRLVRAAINRRRNTAEDEMLYSLELIEEGQNFYGCIILAREEDTLIKEILQALSERGWIGGGRSRGFGRVEIRNIGEIEEPVCASLHERIDSFNEEIDRERGRQSSLVPADKQREGKYFSIDLQSIAIFQDRFGQRKTILEPHLLWEYLGLTGKLPEPELIRSYASTEHISGWSTAWRMPKEVYLGVSAGSLYVYLVRGLDDQLIEALEKAEFLGLGEKREEGYGRIVVCHPFHQEIIPV